MKCKTSYGVLQLQCSVCSLPLASSTLAGCQRLTFQHASLILACGVCGY